jgi:hypothetical protein
VQDQAIQAGVALIVGATIYDRLFAGVRLDEVDEGILIVYPKDDGSADEIANNFVRHISIVASEILDRDVSIGLVFAEGSSVNLRIAKGSRSRLKHPRRHRRCARRQ